MFIAHYSIYPQVDDPHARRLVPEIPEEFANLPTERPPMSDDGDLFLGCMVGLVIAFEGGELLG